jgi:hypothetical protein
MKTIEGIDGSEIMEPILRGSLLKPGERAELRIVGLPRAAIGGSVFMRFNDGRLPTFGRLHLPLKTRAKPLFWQAA